MFTIAVNHERNTILCPHSDHLSFFSVTASLFLCYSFFLSSHHGTKSHTVIIIIFYATNDFSFFFFLLNFRIISKSILHNRSNSIRKLNYDRRNGANTFWYFFFSSCLFFFLEFSCVTSFFSFLFTPFFLFFLLELRCFSSFFGAGHFPFSFWGVPNLFFVFLVSFPCFLFSGALCFLSLSFDRLNKPLRNRFLLVLSRFSDRLRGTMVIQSKTISWTICPSSGTKYDYVPYSQLTECAKWTCNVHNDRIYKEQESQKHVTTSCSGTKPFY